MKFTKILTIALSILFFSTLQAEEKKILLFPIASAASELGPSGKFTEILKEKLTKSEVFDVFIVNDFRYTLKKIQDPLTDLKNAVFDHCKDKKIQSAIFGTIIKNESWYEINVFWYNVEQNDKITEFTQRVFSEERIENSATKCAVDFVARLNSIKSLRFMVSSVFMPGLGQLFLKNHIKSALFFGGVGYFLYRFASGGSYKYIDEDSEVKIVDMGSFQKYFYFFKDKEVSYEFLESKSAEYQDYNKRLDNKKMIFQFAAAAVYLINIADILLSIKQYNDRIRIEKKLTIDVNPFSSSPEICIKYSF
ncbi:DUF5683 domain-containing protein [candidate division KSB1 bacterium]